MYLKFILISLSLNVAAWLSSEKGKKFFWIKIDFFLFIHLIKIFLWTKKKKKKKLSIYTIHIYKVALLWINSPKHLTDKTEAKQCLNHKSLPLTRFSSWKLKKTHTIQCIHKHWFSINFLHQCLGKSQILNGTNNKYIFCSRTNKIFNSEVGSKLKMGRGGGG